MLYHIEIGSFQFVEFEEEDPVKAREKSDEIKQAFKETYGKGLDTKTWNKCLDHYLTEYVMSADDYTNMNQEQTRVIQEIKKAFKRIESRIG